jgi:hypothetical protein
MNGSDLIGWISGVMQLAVACYALRVTRRLGVSAVGWWFFGAFSLLALVHVLTSIKPFGLAVEPGVLVNTFYEVIALLLFASIGHTEVLLWRRRNSEKAQVQERSEAETKFETQRAELTKVNGELQQTVTQLQAEVNLLNETQAQAQKTYQETQEQAQKTYQETLEQLEKTSQEQLTAARQAEEQMQQTAALLRAESDQLKQAQEQAQKTYQETLEQIESTYQQQLTASRGAEAELREIAAGLQAELIEQKRRLEREENTYRDLVKILRESGLHELAMLSRSRVGQIARIAKLLCEHAHARNLGRFITRNAQGRQLPDSLTMLVDYLADEQFLLVKKTDLVRRKLDEVQPSAAAQANRDTIQPPPLDTQLHREPGMPETSRGEERQGSVTFHEHLIDNLTETGTENGPEQHLAAAADEASDLPSVPLEIPSPV